MVERNSIYDIYVVNSFTIAMLRQHRIILVVVATLNFEFLSRLHSGPRQQRDTSVATAFIISHQPFTSSHLNRNDKCRYPVSFTQSDSYRRSSERGSVPVDKTYDNNSPKDIVIDEEGAMLSFFNSREEWLPLFRSVAGTNLPKDTISLLNSITSSPTSTTTTTTPQLTLNDIDPTKSSPWKRYDAIPSDESDRSVVARFLDSMQESLLAIPVMEDTMSRISSNNNGDDVNDDADDENDIQFVEEGRRLLAISRFHVLSTLNNNDNNSIKDSSSIEAVDELFRHCWSEIFVLSQEGVVNSGSIILLPNQHEQQYELSYIRRFLEMNIIQPLQWLGIYDDYEITSFQRDSPVIRMIYKLNDIPKTSYTEEDGFAAS